MQKVFHIEKEIYDFRLLERAIMDFSEIAKIEFSWTNVIIFAENEDEIQEVFSELMNYYIGLFNQ